MKNNHCHLFLSVLVLLPITLFAHQTIISANPSNRFPILSSRMKPLLSRENELEDTLHFAFRELQMENLENLENIENLMNIENIENLEDLENTENIGEEVNHGLEDSSGSNDCEIDSVATARLLSSGTLHSKMRDRRLQNKESQNKRASGSNKNNTWCENYKQCKMVFIFGLGRISVCQSTITCGSETSEGASSAEEQICQTVRTCACVFRPGIGKIQVCRPQLICG